MAISKSKFPDQQGTATAGGADDGGIELPTLAPKRNVEPVWLNPLFVSPVRRDHTVLRHILGRNGRPISAATCGTALWRLQQTPVPVILCDRELPDGSWLDILRHGSTVATPPLVIVASHLADERMWSEVLNLGAFDLIAKPFRSSEVLHVLTTASLYAQGLPRHTAALG